MSDVCVTAKTDKVGSECKWNTGISVEEWNELTEKEKVEIIYDCLNNIIEVGTEDEDGNIVF